MRKERNCKTRGIGLRGPYIHYYDILIHRDPPIPIIGHSLRNETVGEGDYRVFELNLGKGVKEGTHSRWASFRDEGVRVLHQKTLQRVHLRKHGRPSIEKRSFDRLARSRRQSSEGRGPSTCGGRC
jgi:hypothetical protein